MCDDQIELVEPAYRWVDAYMRSVEHPANANDPTTNTTRAQVLDLLAKEPRGRGQPPASAVPSYRFWVRHRGVDHADRPIAGAVSLRISDSFDTVEYFGHIGYHIFPASRGKHLAERATRLLLPFVRQHGKTHVWITCDPGNIASQRTLERLDAEFVETVNVPVEHPLFERSQQKSRFLLRLDRV